MKHRDRLRRRRAKVRNLRAKGLSQRQIASELGVSPSTVNTDLKLAAPRPAVPYNAPEPGNTRAVTHGARSEQRLAPLREKHAAALRQSYPNLDDRRLSLLADRLARIESATRWLDDQDGLMRDAETGEPFGVLAHLEKWANRAEVVLKEIDLEQRQSRRFDGLSDFMDEANGDG